MKITVPELSLVLLVGPSGCGKSTFARQHFKPTEVLSSDYCRGLVSDDENDQTSTKEAFEVLHFIARKRLAAGRMTVVDATNVQPDSRKPLVALAREFHVLPIAIVFDFPEKVCQERNQTRPNRDFGPHVVRNQAQQLRRSLRGLEREGFRGVQVFKSPEELEGLEIVRQPMWTNRRYEHGPFDIIGDVHGCFDELRELMTSLGYSVEKSGDGYRVGTPEGRKAIFLGDLVDRGPKPRGPTVRLQKGEVGATAQVRESGPRRSRRLLPYSRLHQPRCCESDPLSSRLLRQPEARAQWPGRRPSRG
jgi:protein phosphatase